MLDQDKVSPLMRDIKNIGQVIISSFRRWAFWLQFCDNRSLVRAQSELIYTLSDTKFDSVLRGFRYCFAISFRTVGGCLT